MSHTFPGRPRDYLLDPGGDFIEDPLVPDAPDAVLLTQWIARTIRTGIGTRTIAQVATAAGVTRRTLHNLLAGHTTPDVGTLVALARALDVGAWPTDLHRTLRGLRRDAHPLPASTGHRRMS